MPPRTVRFTLLPLSFIFGLARGASAQQPAAAPEVPARYAQEAAVIEHLDTVYRYAADGTGSKQVTMALRVQTDAAARQFGVISIAYAGANEHIEFDYVRVRHPDGSVVETPAAEALEMPAEVTRQAPLYSDLKEKQLPVRSLRVGDVLEYRARSVRATAEAPGEFWGSDSLITNTVVLAETIELHVPLGKEVTVWSPKSKPAITEKDGDRIYTWTGSHLAPAAGPEAEAKKEADKTRAVTPEEAKDLQFGEYPLIAWTTFKSWDAVGAWYRGLEDGRLVPDAEIKSKVAGLIAGKTTEEEKVRAIYGYVATNIRYIGVDLGIGRYQPHLASEVLRNQYGDCKDKHTLLAAMLTEAGFKPSAVLIGVNVRFNPDVPSPQAFNHVITQVPVSGQTVWLDSTEEVAPYRAMFAILRDKDALVIPPSGTSSIQKTPADLPYPSFERFDTAGTLTADGISESHFVITARGDDELVLRQLLHQISPGQYDEFIQRFSQGLSFGGTTSHAEISRPESTDEPIRIAYDYKREKPGDWDNFRITPNIPFVNISPPDEKDPPKIPIELGAPRVESASSSLKLPDGWGATLPASIHVKTPFATFDKTYRFEKGTLYCDRKLEILQRELPAADWKVFKKFTDDIGLPNEPWVQLTSTGKRSSGPAPPAPSVNNDEAARLVSQAIAETQGRRFDEAQSDLDQAKKLNDQQAYLWSTYAFISMSRGNLSDSIASYKKELALHPDELGMYLSLSQMQLGLGQRKEAEATLRTRLSEGGPDESTSLLLASMLSEDEDYAAAVQVLEAARDSRPGNPNTRLQLARAHFKAGRKTEATKELDALTKDSIDPEILNGAAYELADANLEIDLADTAIHKALDILAETSASAAADEDANVAIKRSRLIVASWDTLGWLRFRQHRNSEAETYIRAAWQLEPGPEIGLHLGQLEEARGDIDAAFTTCSIAASSAVKYGLNGVKQPPSPLARDLNARVEALRAKGAKTPAKFNAETDVEMKIVTPNGKIETKTASSAGTFDPMRARQDLTTVPLGKADGAHGTRQFTIVLSASGIVADKPADGQPALKNDEAILHRLETKSWWPENSPVRLYSKGALNCHQDICEFRYFPL